MSNSSPETLILRHYDLKEITQFTVSSISKNMREIQYKVICFQCRSEKLSKKIELECLECNSRFIENQQLKRIPFTSGTIISREAHRSSVSSTGFQLFVSSHGLIQNRYDESTTAPLATEIPVGRKAVSETLETCTICLETIAKGDIINDLENCCHTFHSKCIAQWLKIKNSCPSCNSTPAFSLAT